MALLPRILNAVANVVGYFPDEPPAIVRQAVPEDREAEDVGPLRDRTISRNGDWSTMAGSFLQMVTGNPDSVLRKQGGDLKLYDALLDDDVAFSSLQQRRLAIVSRDWEVAPGDDTDPRSVQAADDFRAMIKAVGWDRVTGLLHYATWYGYAVAEAVYTTKVHDGRRIVWLADIVVPDRRWFGFTPNGELRQIGAASGALGEDELPPRKFAVVRTGHSHDFAFYGVGLAHWAYWPIFFKRSIIKFWSLYLEKFGMPTVAIEFTEAQRNDVNEKAKLLQAGVAIGQDRAVLLPPGTLEENRLKLIEAERSGSGASSYQSFYDAQNEALMRIILGQPGTSKATPGGLGGDGQASKDEGVKLEIVKSDSDTISEAINSTFATWFTIWNHGEDVAPPTVYRVLDDAEDVGAVAKRDVDLDGIGIRRTAESVKETYGGGYVLERAAPPVVPLPGDQAATDRQTNNRARIAARALAFGVEDEAPLYVSRKLLNAADLIAWAKSQGIKSTVPADDLHCTILYSKNPVDWFKLAEYWNNGDDEGRITIAPGGPRSLDRFGRDGDEDRPLVLRFASTDFDYRHRSMIEAGASSDYPEFKPHITLSYDAADVDLAAIEPYQGKLVFGPEIFEPIKAKEYAPGDMVFGAREEAAIERLIGALSEEANPIFGAMGDAMRTNLQGVSTLEGARVAILSAFEAMPIEQLAKLTALPLLAERAGALIGAEGYVDA